VLNQSSQSGASDRTISRWMRATSQFFARTDTQCVLSPSAVGGRYSPAIRTEPAGCAIAFL